MPRSLMVAAIVPVLVGVVAVAGTVGARVQQGPARTSSYQFPVAEPPFPQVFARATAAKAGITGFTRAAAMEAAPHGIRVNAVAPGLAWNPFLGKIYGEEYVAEMAQRTPLGRVGQPQDVANAVAFLASERASFITGEVLCVSGGYYLHT